MSAPNDKRTLGLTTEIIAEANGLLDRIGQPTVLDIADRLVAVTHGGYIEREVERRRRMTTLSETPCSYCGESMSLEQADRCDVCAACEFLGDAA